MSVDSTQIKNNTMGAITVADGTGTPVTLALSFECGDWAFTDIGGYVLNEFNDFEARGNYKGSAPGKRKYPKIAFSAWLTAFKSTAAAGPMNAYMLKTAPYTANISTLGSGRVYAFDVTITIEGTDFGDSADHTATFEDCRVESCGFTESDESTKWGFQLKCLGAITGDLALAQTP